RSRDASCRCRRCGEHRQRLEYSFMTDLVILGTDTDAGKTTFALLWLAAFGEDYEYWKPVEAGPSDSELIKRLLPHAEVHSPVKRLAEAVAPPLAARHAQDAIPS